MTAPTARAQSLSPAGRSLQSEPRKFRLDDVVHVVLAKFVRHADGVLDGVGVRSSVTDNRNSLDAQERGATVFRVVESAFEIAKGVLSENIAHFSGKRLLQFLP